MENKDNKKHILEHFAQHEEAISRLYKEYGDLFSDDFWKSLAEEEKKHAAWIRSLKEKLLDKNIVYFNENRFKKEAITSSIKYIEEETDLARRKGITEIKAYSVAMNLENALLESKIFEIFKADAVELKYLFKKLNNETTKHREKIKDILDEKIADKNNEIKN